MKDKLPVLILFIVLLGSFFTGVMILLDHHTAPMIEKIERVNLKKSVMDVLDIPYAEKDIEKLFEEAVTARNIGNQVFYVSDTGNVIFPFEGPGLWGSISGIVALEPDGDTIKGINILHHEETPGLGGRIEEPGFLNTLKGKKVLSEIKIVPAGKSKGANAVDAITAATLTSKAFAEILNNDVSDKAALYKNR